MKIIAINGSPRVNWHTSQLVEKALEGAKSKGAEVEVISLYKLNFKGCISCFACKRNDSKSLYRCAVKDDLAPVFEKIRNADALIFASPIYFNDVTGEMRSFVERLLFQYLPYESGIEDNSYFPRKMQTAFIYSMGAPTGKYKDEVLEILQAIEMFISQIFRMPIKTLYSNNAYQFDDYSKYKASAFDLDDKIRQRDEIFPLDLQKAFELGEELATTKE